MSIQEQKITEAAIAANGVQSRPDKLTGTAAQNKKVFDNLVTAVVREGAWEMAVAMRLVRIWAVVIRLRLPLAGTTILHPGCMSLRLRTRVTVPFMLMANTRDSLARRLKPPDWLM